MALNKSDVSALYVAIFNRASEGEGNAFWQTKGTTAEVANAMLETDPAKEYFGAALDDDQAFVEHIYLNTLGKTLADDAEGIAYWVGELATQSRGEVIARLIESAKDPANAGAAQDLFLNMVAVSDFAADTLEDAPADLNALRFDAGLQGVTADPATVEAANAKVEQVLNPVDPLTGALNQLVAAKKELNDFIEAAKKNELVVELNNGDVDGVQVKAVAALATAMVTMPGIASGTLINGTETPAVIQAKIGDAIGQLNVELAAKQKVLDAASADVAKVPGLQNALTQLAAREAAAKKADTAAEAAKNSFEAESVKFAKLDNDLAAAINAISNSTIDITKDAPALLPGVTEAKHPGVTALLNAAVASYVAEVADAAADEALKQAQVAVIYLDGTGSKTAIAEAIAAAQNMTVEETTAFVAGAAKLTQQQVQNALNKAQIDHKTDTAPYDTLKGAVEAFQANADTKFGVTSTDAIDAGKGVANAEGNITKFNEKLADLLEATDLQGELKAKSDAVESAVDAFEELGVEAPQSLVKDGSVIATVGSDLFLSDASDSTILYFGQQGEDRLWVGEANELIVLGASNNINTQSLGDKSVMEVFAKQAATGVELWVEKQAFAGNAINPSATDLVKITLSGVSVDDLVLEDGFLSIA